MKERQWNRSNLRLVRASRSDARGAYQGNLERPKSTDGRLNIPD